jgi:3-hydroxyacyl-CoA dehydrogenase
MGMFEMVDLSGNDIGYRQRTELGLTSKASRDPSLRYCSLPDKLCERGFFGQKTSRGWYQYEPSAPRTPVVSEDTLQLIADHRKQEVRL